MKWWVFGARIFVTSGVIMGVVNWLFLRDTTLAVAQGVAFGALFSLGIVSLTAYRLRGQWGAGPSPRQQAAFHVPARPEEVHARARYLLAALPAASMVDAPGHLEVRTRAGWRSWGEVISVDVRETGQDAEVAIACRPRLRPTMVDYGRAHLLVTRLADQLRA